MIFPKPHKEEYKENKYKLTDFDDNLDLLYLYNKYKSGTPDITIKSNLAYIPDEYSLVIDDTGITITAYADSGIFCAIASLKQLLKKHGDSLPHADIWDKPDFKRRSYMLDISRNRMPKVETIKRLIDLLADLKYNEFQLYMESFCFKYSAYPEYTADFDCLTPEDIENLDKYCSDRFIELVPNQNCFGHMGTWLAEDELKHLELGYPDNKSATINPLLPETLEVVDNIFGSLLPYFKSDKVNIGMDEAYGLGKYQIEDICSEIGADNVFMDYLNKINDMCKNKYGKKIMFWNDMIASYPDSFKRVPEDAIVLNWGYDLIKNTLVENKCRDMSEKRLTYYMCPGNCTWLSFTGRFDVMSFNIRTYAEIGKRYNADGYMLTDWGCGEGHMHFPVQSLIPCALAAQYAWNVGVEQNGGMLKADYIHDSMNYINDVFFEGKDISKYIYRLQQYYLYEPERIHCSTMCCLMMRKSLKEKVIPFFFDLNEFDGEFYFQNVIDYVNKNIADIEKEDFDERLKRELIINARMVILAEEFMIIRTNDAVSEDKIAELIAMIDDIAAEYRALWMPINYEKGIEDYLDQLNNKKQELLDWNK